MTDAELETLLSSCEVHPGGLDTPLELSSLQFLSLVDELEAATGSTFPVVELTREHFDSRRTILALLSRKGLR